MSPDWSDDGSVRTGFQQICLARHICMGRRGGHLYDDLDGIFRGFHQYFKRF